MSDVYLYPMLQDEHHKALYEKIEYALFAAGKDDREDIMNLVAFAMLEFEGDE